MAAVKGDVSKLKGSSTSTSPSIVADVLQKKGKTHTDDFHRCMKQLSQKTEEVKAQIYEVIYKQYTEFYHTFTYTSDLYGKVTNLVEEMNSLADVVRNEVKSKLLTTTTEIKELNKEYNRTEEIINALRRLCKIHENLTGCIASIQKEDYLKASLHIKNVRKNLNGLSSGTCESKIFKSVREEYRVQNALLMSKLEEAWSNLIQWNAVTAVSWDSIEGHLKTQLKVKIPSEDNQTSSNLTDLFKSMECLDVFDPKLKTFASLNKNKEVMAKKILRYLLKPLIMFSGLKPVVHRDNEVATIKFERESSKSKARRPEPYKQKTGAKIKQDNPNYEKAILYPKLCSALEFLTQFVFTTETLMERSADESSAEQKDSPKTDKIPSSIEKLRVLIWPELSELIIKECLASSVPSTSSQLQKYDSIIKVTSNFENHLQSIGKHPFMPQKDAEGSALQNEENTGFLSEDQCTLSSYVKDINVHFANKKCQDLLVEARDLMTSEIHNMVKIERKNDRAAFAVDHNADGGLTKATKTILSGVSDLPEDFLGTKTFHFPECRISESTKKLMDLIYNTLLEATTSTPQIAVQLFYSARNMFELFCDVVPTYHKESLELPQLAALHYNNSMYLAHHCVTLGHQFRSCLPDPLKQSVATFVDLVPVLRRAGQSCFLQQLRNQKSQLLEIVKDCGGFVDCNTEERITSIERAFKQIIHQLVRLSKVWKDVLPKNIYEKCIGLLFNVVLNEICSQIIRLEDISADEGSQLHWLLSILVNRAGEIFNLKTQDNAPEDKGFVIHIPSWQKFNELINVLDSSLQGIVDRWADGKGILAQAFDSGEVRNLIRALFQNTDRRAQALSKIKMS